MFKLLRLLFLLCLVCTMHLTFATSYFVSTTGDDNNAGTIGMPFKTIQFAMDQLQAGDILNIRDGNYNEKLEFYTSGTNSHPIVIQNYNNESPIIDGTGISNRSVLLYLENISFLTIKGIHFKNNTVNDGGGIMAQGSCHDLIIQNNKISNISFSTNLNDSINSSTNASPLLIYADTAPDSAYNILISGNEVFDNVTGYSENISLDGNISNFEISENIVHDNTNIGIDVLGNYDVSPMSQFDHARYGVVKNNTIFNCNAPGNTAAGIYVDGGHHIVVENNISHHNGYGGEIGCEESGTTDDVIFRNNVFYSNYYTGMQLGGYDFVNTGGKVVNSKVLNNTFYKNDVGNTYNGELSFTQFENGVVQNNIFQLTPQNVLTNATLGQPNLSMDYNLVFGDNGENQLEGDWGSQSYTSFSEFKTISNTNSHSSFADPLFENPTQHDFHLKSNSPAIDKGNPNFTPANSEVDLDGQNRVNNGRVDCGVDESTVSSNPNTASVEMTLKGTWDDQNSSTSGVHYNDLWGYVDCQGNEYAILGSPKYVHIIDVTDPTQPNEVKRFTPGATTIWRDFKTYRTYAYGVADQGSEGLLVFDLSNLPNSNISMVNQITTDFQHCHNIFIDEPNGRLYVVGSNTIGNGVIVYDIATDPANPIKIASPILSPGGYIHDAYVKNNILYGSHGYNGFHVWDFTNPTTPIHLASATSNGYNHSNWISEDGQYAFIAEEVPSGLPLLTIDISNMANDDIEIVKEFKDPLLAPAHTNSTPHNPYVRGNYLITSYYEDGVQIHDISDPLNPVLVAHYDTYPENTNYNGTTGNWGVYPYFPSGNIIASDTKHGLFVLKADNITLSTIVTPTSPITEIGAEGGNTMCFGQDKELVATQGAENYVWYRNGTEIDNTLTNTITISEAGNYSVTGFNGYCSTESSTIQITQNGEIDATITASLGTSFCSNEINTLTAPDGFTYVWSNDATTSSIEVNSEGDYSVTVTDGNGCSASSQITLQTLTPPIVNLDASSQTICSDETIHISASGGGTYLWDGGQTTSSIDVNEAGVYTVTVALENGCSEVNEIEIVQGSTIDATIESSNGQQICEGTSTELTVTSASSYLWDNGMTTQSISVAAQGLYQVTVTNETGCTSQAQIQINVLPAPNEEIIGSSSLCNNGSIELMVTGNQTYLWDTEETTNTITVSEAGTYTVTVTNPSNSCQQIIKHTVTNLPDLTPTITASSNLICAGESVTLTATGGTIFDWSTEENTSTIIVDQAGLYSVTVTDASGCSGTTQINIEKINFDFEITGDVSLCSGNTGNLSASDGISWSWSNGQFGQTIEITAPGEYAVTATSADGCMKTKSIVVEEGAAIEVEISSDNGFILCQDGSITLSVNNPGMTYEWSNGANTESTTIQSDGEYSVTVTNESGCTGESTISVQKSNFSVDIEGDLTICSSNTELTATEGNAWIWSTGATTQSIQVSSPGEYTVTATDSNGCTATKTVTVSENAFFPEITINTELSSCDQTVIQVAQEYASYLWDTEETSQQIAVTTSGVYTVTVTNSNGCTGVNEIEIQIDKVNAQIEGDEAFCKGTTTTLTASGGTDYHWNTGESSNSIDISNPGHYIVTVTNSSGCTGVADYVVEYFPNTEVVIQTNDIPLCEGNTVNLSTTQGAMFEWSTGDQTSNIDVTESGVYAVTVTDENGCINDNEIEIKFNPLPQGTIASSNGFEFCKGTATTLSIEGTDADITWIYGNENLGNTTSIETDNAGTYYAELSLNGCTTNTESVELTVLEPVVPVLSQSGEDLVSTSANSYQWYYNDILIANQDGQTMTPIISGSYYVITTDENGCEAKSNAIDVVVSSVNNISWISKANLFPNPTANIINLAIQSNIKQSANISIKNLLGQVFLREGIDILPNQNTFQFNTTSYPSGMYFLVIEDEGTSKILKFVVER